VRLPIIADHFVDLLTRQNNTLKPRTDRTINTPSNWLLQLNLVITKTSGNSILFVITDFRYSRLPCIRGERKIKGQLEECKDGDKIIVVLELLNTAKLMISAFVINSNIGMLISLIVF